MRTALLLAATLAGPCVLAQQAVPHVTYDFEEGSGGVAMDGSAAGLHLSPSGVPQWTAGFTGWGVATAPGSFLVAQQPITGENLKAITVQAWVKVTGDGSSHDGKLDNLAAVVSNRSGAAGFMLAVTNSEPYKAVWVINGLRPGGHILYSNQTFPANEWVHVAGVFGGSFVALYVDGAETRRDIEPSEMAASPAPLAIGAENPGTNYYQLNGVVDRVRIHVGVEPSSAATIAREAKLEPSEAAPPQVDAEGKAVLRPMRPAPGGASQRLVMVANQPPADFVGDSEAPIAAAISRVAQTGGGTVLIKGGEYAVSRTFELQSVRDVAIVGIGRPVLKFAGQVHTRVATAGKPGDTHLALEAAEGLRPGDQLEVQAPGRVDSFSKRQTPYFTCTVRAVDATRVELTQPLQYDTPVGAVVVRIHNMFRLLGHCQDLVFQGLTLDGNIRETDVPPINHVYHCAMTANGPYSEDSFSEQRPTRISVLGCTIRGFHHRGLAWYNVADSVVSDCVIEDTHAEAIDFDHYCVRCTASGNQVARCAVGVEINDASHSLVTGNRVQECGVGLNIWRWYHGEELNMYNVVTGNSFIGSRGAGIAVAEKTEANQIRGNSVRGSAKAGIVVAGQRNSVTDNKVTGNAEGGIRVSGERNLVAGNSCAGNGGAGDLEVSGEGNIVQDNQIN